MAILSGASRKAHGLQSVGLRASAAEGGVTADAPREGHAVRRQQQQDPAGFEQQFAGELLIVIAAEENCRRRVGQELGGNRSSGSM
jgi:hypothetical protein